jgi:thiamine transporter
MVKLKENLILLIISMIVEVIFKFVNIFENPYANKVSFSLLMIIIIAYKDGTLKGIIYGLIFGIFNYVLYYSTFNIYDLVCNYLLAFISVGVAGYFRSAINGNLKQFRGGIIFTFFVKYLIHSISGIFLLKNVVEGNVFYNSFIEYNLIHSVFSCLLCILIGNIFYKNYILKYLNQKF